MIKSMQKTLIAASVGAVLAAGSFAAHAADNLLFPYITTKQGAFTFVSVQNNATADTSTLASSPYHFYYMYKSNTAKNSDACNHFDGVGSTTVNDLLQFEVSNRVDLVKGFGDDTSKAVTLEKANAQDSEGFLIIAPDASNTNIGYHGEATIVDASNNLFFSYSTADLTTPGTASGGTNPDFSTVSDAAFGKVTSWYPASAVQTSWYVLPTATLQTMADANGGGGAVAKFTVNGGAFDNNEAFFSGAKTPSVTCFGKLRREDFLSSGAAGTTANGGWMATTLATDADNTATGFLQYKLQTSGALGRPVATIARDTANGIPVVPTPAPVVAGGTAQ